VVRLDAVGDERRRWRCAHEEERFNACWDETTERRVQCLPNYFAWQLDGYTGPPEQRGPLPIELVDRGSYQFIKYVPPEFPPIALSARVFCDVRVLLGVDRQSGRVTWAEAVDGPALLHEAALKAARQWEFVPGTTPVNPFEVTLAFQLRCASQ
jgi:hypothetical protein